MSLTRAERENLKIGDEVAIRRKYANSFAPVNFSKVAKITATQITLENGDRYTKSYGDKVGGSTVYKDYLCSAQAERDAVVDQENAAKQREILATAEQAVKKARFHNAFASQPLSNETIDDGIMHLKAAIAILESAKIA